MYMTEEMHTFVHEIKDLETCLAGCKGRCEDGESANESELLCSIADMLYHMGCLKVAQAKLQQKALQHEHHAHVDKAHP